MDIHVHRIGSVSLHTRTSPNDALYSDWVDMFLSKLSKCASTYKPTKIKDIDK